MSQSKINLAHSTSGGWSAGNIWRYRLWRYFGTFCFRLMISRKLQPLRCWWLRLFGAQIGERVLIPHNARVDFPWFLRVGDNAWIGEEVWFYNMAPITVGDHVVISHGTTLCTGSHQIYTESFDLYVKPITVSAGAWLAMKCFVHPGVSIGTDAVVGACSVVTRDVPENMICTGNPCIPIKMRFPTEEAQTA